MPLPWMVLHPGYYVQERQRLAYHYPNLRISEELLQRGILALCGDLIVRPPAGPIGHPVILSYPSGAPHERPTVIALEALPKTLDIAGFRNALGRPKLLDHRHQMRDGSLCLFQRETRRSDILSAIDVLRRAEKWFAGVYTGHWPPDTQQSELESHFPYAGDVLVAAPFFADEIHGHGRLLFTQDIRRCRINPDEKSFPLILTALTQEKGGVVRTIDARQDLSRLYPWIEDKAWDPNLLAAADEPKLAEASCLVHGYWWSIPAEPTPLRAGENLLGMLASRTDAGDAWPLVGALMGSDLNSERQHILGLRYPARGNGWEWLIFILDRTDKRAQGVAIIRGEAEKRTAFRNSRILGSIHVHRVEPEALRLRNRGVVDEKEIGSKTVALIGLGALGSKVAEMLAQAGVGHFRLCDSDVLATGNVARHIGGVCDYGARKTRVAIGRLLEINPYLDCAEDDLWDQSAVSDRGRLADFIRPADLVVSTMADESAESVLNEVAILEGKPVLYGRSLREASIGRVFLVRPGRDACKHCLAHYAVIAQEGGATPADWVAVSEDATAPLLHECGRPVIAGSAVDLSFTATLTARLALDFLEGNSSDSNHWLWTRRPAAEIDPRLASPMSTFIGRVERRKGCPACQEPDVVEIVMSREAHAMITSLTEGSAKDETGGILIGFLGDQNRAVVVAATAPGPNATRTATLFRRDVPYVQSKLDEAAAQLGPKGVYVGEWHSHLTPDPHPSYIDVESLFGIARVPNYLTRCPVLVIAGLDPTTAKVAAVRTWAFPIGGRSYDIPYRLVSREEALAIAPASPDV